MPHNLQLELLVEQEVFDYLKGTPEPVDMVSVVMGSMEGSRKDPASGRGCREPMTSAEARELLGITPRE